MAQGPLIPGDDIEKEQLRTAVEEARDAARRGEVIPHEKVREWLQNHMLLPQAQADELDRRIGTADKDVIDAVPWERLLAEINGRFK